MSTPSPRFVGFGDLLLAETVRLIEARAPLDDAAAMRAAARAATGREERIVERARLLAGPLDIGADIERLRRAVRWSMVALLAVGALLASSIVYSVLGEGRTVNAAGALALALLPNVIGLPAWIAAVLLAGSGEGVVGRALGSAARLGWLRRRAPQVLAAASGILDRHRLSAWVWGGANHVLWAVAYLVALAAMAFAFGVRSYRLGWETTILTPGFFDALYRIVALGLVDDAAAVAAGGQRTSAALAWWLMGGVLVWGFGLRVAALALCWARWLRGRRRLAIDLSDPYYRRLLNRFDAIAPARVVDVERPAPTKDGGRGTTTASSDAVVIAFELPPEVDVPADVLAATTWSERIDGTQDERCAISQRLADRRPGRLLLACHAGSTPDRGTRRFIEGVRAQSTALLLLPVDCAAAGLPRWRAWLDDSGLDVALVADARAALEWFEAS